jgi:hypothetical protein
MNSPTRAQTPTRHDEFIDLVYADEQLLRAEFDAIVAHGWPDEPTSSPRAKPIEPAQPMGAPQCRLTVRATCPLTPGRPRQRSPPAGQRLGCWWPS